MEDLLQNSYFILFVIISIGIAVGKIKVRGFGLDISAVIFVALLFGHWGYTVPDDFMKIGLVLFIFTVGIQAGPGFFEAFKKDGRKLFIVTLTVILTASLISLGFYFVFDIEMPLSVGVLTGALTSTPGLAAAMDSTGSSLAPIGYGIAYVFGVVCVILLLNVLPAIFRIHIKKEEEDFEESVKSDYPEIHNIKIEVSNPNVHDKTIGELRISEMTGGAIVSRVMTGAEAFTPNESTVIKQGDKIKLVGTQRALDKALVLLGTETNCDIPLSAQYVIQWLLVTNKSIVNKKYSEVALPAYYNATVLKIKRSGVEISPKASGKFRFGDRIMVGADVDNMKKVEKLVGNSSQKLSNTDFLPIALGIVIGVLIGNINIPIAGIDFKLGITGGVLTAGIVLSRIGKTGPIIWSMSGAANGLIRRIGLLFFLSAVGVEAGRDIAATFSDYGFELITASVFIAVIPILVAGFLGKYILKMNFLSLMGAIAGSMTSTPGLIVANSKSDANAASVAYATVYPFALVAVIIVTQLFALL